MLDTQRLPMGVAKNTPVAIKAFPVYRLGLVVVGQKLQRNRQAVLQSQCFGMICTQKIISELEGFPVQMVTKVMGGTMTNTAKKIEQKKLKKSLFGVPKGYRLVEQQ